MAGHEARRYTIIRKDDVIRLETYILQDIWGFRRLQNYGCENTSI